MSSALPYKYCLRLCRRMRGCVAPAAEVKVVGLRPWYGLWPITGAEPERGA